MRVRAWMMGLLALAMAGMLLVAGCAAPQQATEPTPEELAARQDSIAKANEQQLKIARMFAYDNLKQQQYEAAKKYLWQVEELDVKNQYNEWDRLYQTYMALDKADSAQIVLQMGLEEFPRDAFLNATYGFILKAKGQNQDALMYYNTALEGDISEENRIDYLRKKAEIFQQLQQPEDAIATYEALLEISPDDMGAKNELTALVRTHRNPEEYIQRLEADLAENPDDMQKRMDLMRAYEEQNLNQKVVEQADQILQRDPSRIMVYEAKAKAYDNLNQLDNSIATWEALLEQDAGNTNAMLRIADNHRLLDRFTSARSWVMKAKNAGGSTGEANYILGLTYESSGDKCSGDGLTYDDKLVYTIALGLFRQAADSDDYTIKGKAASRVDYMKQFAPQKSDWFLNQSQNMPEKDCYGWINAGWPETKYIGTYLSQFAG